MQLKIEESVFSTELPKDWVPVTGYVRYVPYEVGYRYTTVLVTKYQFTYITVRTYGRYR
jgi:hypothetical protein